MPQLLDDFAVDQDDPSRPSWVEVRRTASRRAGRDLALVLQAMHVEHALFEHGPQTILVVRPEDAQRAADECERYENENANWPPRGEALGNLSEGLIGAFGWFAIFTVTEILARTHALGFDWTEHGRGIAGRERTGEYWRAFTGLSLHVDLSHFLSNLLFGALLTLLTCELIGGGLGLSAILAAGALGNLLNALLQSADHTSVGASTAVFAALGLLVTYQWRRRHQLRQSPWRRWAPIFAGGFLLASLGISGDAGGQTARAVDYGAHATGFLAGALAGWLCSLFRVRQLANPALQTTALVLAPVAMAIAWSFAF